VSEVPSFNINYTAAVVVAEGDAIALGDLLLFDAAGRVWRKATAANRALYGVRAQAVALSTFSGAGTGVVAYKDGGTLPTQYSGLSSGTATWVRSSSTGRIERVASPTSSDDIVGRCDVNGRVNLMFGVLTDVIYSGSSVADDIAKSTGSTIDRVQGFRGESLDGDVPDDDQVWVKRSGVYVADYAMPKRWVSPRKYGAVLDGVTDDILAFEAMHLDLPTEGAVIYIDGLVWLSRTWRISKHFTILGFGGVGTYHSGFFGAPGYTVLQFDSAGNSLDGNAANGFTVERIDIKSRILLSQAYGDTLGYGIPIWNAVESVSLGDCRIKQGNVDPDYMYRATAITANGGLGPGTTGAAQPAFSPVVGATLVENGITWTTEHIPRVHQTSTAYTAGKRVFAPIDNRYYFECETPGTTAASRPAELVGGDNITNLTIDGTVTDGTVVWRIKCAAGMRVHAAYGKIRDVYIRGFSGADIVNAGGVGMVAGGYTQAHALRIDGLLSEYIGVGVTTSGDDCNGWEFVNYFGVNVGTLHPDPNTVTAAGFTNLGGHHFIDGSQYGGIYTQCYCQTSTGRPILKYGTGYTQANNFAQEVTQKSLNKAGGLIVIGGTLRGGIDAASVNTIVVDPSGSYGRGLSERDPTGAVALRAALTAFDGLRVHTFSAEESGDINGFGLRYASGWWGLRHGPQAANDAYLLSGAGAGLGYGAGHIAFPLGKFYGNYATTTPIWHGHSTSLTDKRVRNSTRKQGDTFFSQTDTQTLLEDGYRGATWTAATQVTAAYAPWGLGASSVEPTANTGKPGEQVWRCTTDGTTGGAEPAWPAAPTPGVTTQADGTAVWTFAGYRPARVLEQRASKTRGPHYRAKDVTTTLATANQVLDDGGVVNGEDLALPESSMCIVSHTITVKKTGTANGGDITIRSVWVRNGSAAPAQIGTGATSPTYNLSGATLDGSTVRHAANGNRIELQCTPETAETLYWGVLRTQIERVDG
jgi:hypothetical protein